MPFLSRRRSTLDLLTRPETSSGDAKADTANGHLKPGPASPRPRSAYGIDAIVSRDGGPESPPLQPPNANTKRFSMLKFRNFSESALSQRAREDASKENVPPMPDAPIGEVWWNWRLNAALLTRSSSCNHQDRANNG